MKKTSLLSLSLILASSAAQASGGKTPSLSPLARLKESRSPQLKIAGTIPSIIKTQVRQSVGRGNSDTMKFRYNSKPQKGDKYACYVNSVKPKSQQKKYSCSPGYTLSSGKQSSFIGSDWQVPCPAGMYNNDTSCVCHPCPPATYSDKEGSTVCIACGSSSGKYAGLCTKGHGSDARNICYSTGTECKPCIPTKWFDGSRDEDKVEGDDLGVEFGLSLNKTACIACPHNYFIGTSEPSQGDSDQYDNIMNDGSLYITSSVKNPSPAIELTKVEKKIYDQVYYELGLKYSEKNGKKLNVKQGVCYPCPSGEVLENKKEGRTCLKGSNGKYCCLCGTDTEGVPMRYDRVTHRCEAFACAIGQVKMPDGTCVTCPADMIPDVKGIKCEPCNDPDKGIITRRMGGMWVQMCEECAVNEYREVVDGVPVCVSKEIEGPTECKTGESFRLLLASVRKIRIRAGEPYHSLFQIEACDGSGEKGGFVERATSDGKDSPANLVSGAWIGPTVYLAGKAEVANTFMYLDEETVFTKAKIGHPQAGHVSIGAGGMGLPALKTISFGEKVKLDAFVNRKKKYNEYHMRLADGNLEINSNPEDVNSVVISSSHHDEAEMTTIYGGKFHAKDGEIKITGGHFYEGASITKGTFGDSTVAGNKPAPKP